MNETLGSGEIKFTASRNGTETKRRATLSVRPAVPFVTDVRSGSFKKASIDIPIKRQMYTELAKRDAAISATPLGLAHGLDAYLKSFPLRMQRTNYQRRVLSTRVGKRSRLRTEPRRSKRPA